MICQLSGCVFTGSIRQKDRPEISSSWPKNPNTDFAVCSRVEYSSAPISVNHSVGKRKEQSFCIPFLIDGNKNGLTIK